MQAAAMPVSVESEIYRTYHLDHVARQPDVVFADSPFGDHLLNLLAMDPNFVDPYLGITAADRAATEKEKLRASLDPARRTSVNAFLAAMYPEVTNNDSGTDLEPLEKVRSLSDDDFVAFLRRHSVTTSGLMDAFRVEAESAKASYLRRFVELSERGQLPLDVVEKVTKKLSQTRLVPLDPIAPDGRVTTDYDGIYEHRLLSAKVVLIPFDPERQRKTTTHELTHAVSGLSVEAEKIEHRKWLSRQLGRVGLRTLTKPKSTWIIDDRRIGFRESKKTSSAKFHWINEAITEHVAQLINGDNTTSADGDQVFDMLLNGTNQSYHQERELLGTILTAADGAIPLMSFLDAYFEDEDVSASSEEGKRPKFTALSQKLDTIFGDRFMDRLDDFLARSQKAGMTKNDALAEARKRIEIDPQLLDEDASKMFDCPPVGLQLNQQLRSLASMRRIDMLGQPIPDTQTLSTGESPIDADVYYENTFIIDGTDLLLAFSAKEKQIANISIIDTVTNKEVQYLINEGAFIVANYRIGDTDTIQSRNAVLARGVDRSILRDCAMLKHRLIAGTAFAGKADNSDYTLLNRVIQELYTTQVRPATLDTSYTNFKA